MIQLSDQDLYSVASKAHNVQLPSNVLHDRYCFMQNLDEENENTKWADARELELKQIDDYNTFHDKGKEWEGAPEFKKIKVHFVCDVKHDG